MEKKLEGFNTRRHKSNPKEEDLHNEFVERFNKRDMDYLVFGHSKSRSGAIPDDHLSERERRIVVSTIQWLGSPVGQGFLRGLGYCEEDDFVSREKLFSSKIACLEQKLDKIPKWIKSIFK